MIFREIYWGIKISNRNEYYEMKLPNRIGYNNVRRGAEEEGKRSKFYQIRSKTSISGAFLPVKLLY